LVHVARDAYVTGMAEVLVACASVLLVGALATIAFFPARNER
jgi:hypothetical protein